MRMRMIVYILLVTREIKAKTGRSSHKKAKVRLKLKRTGCARGNWEQKIPEKKTTYVRQHDSFFKSSKIGQDRDTNALDQTGATCHGYYYHLI